MYLSHKKNIVFITGAFVSHSSWEEWIIYFENKGYKVVAPPWVNKNETSENLRSEHPNSKIALVSLNSLMDYYTEIIGKLPEKPILIGHSYGGLLVQLLIQKEIGSAGICINSLPPKNISIFSFSFYKTIWKPLSFFSPIEKTYLMPFKKWQHLFTNKMSFEEQKNSYEKFIIPESKKVLRDIFFNGAKIDFKKSHNPLLFLSGSADNFSTVSMQYSNFKNYKNLHSVTSYKRFEDKNHFAIGQENWKNIAEYIANWLEKESLN